MFRIHTSRIAGFFNRPGRTRKSELQIPCASGRTGTPTVTMWGKAAVNARAVQTLREAWGGFGIRGSVWSAGVFSTAFPETGRANPFRGAFPEPGDVRNATWEFALGYH